MDKIFSGGISLSRVNPFGLVLMLIALAVTFLAKPLAARLAPGRENAYSAIRLAAALVCAVGALIAIL